MRVSQLLAGVILVAITGIAAGGCSLVKDERGRSGRGAGGGTTAGVSREGVRDQAAVKPVGSALSASAATGGLLIELPEGFTLTFAPVPRASVEEQAVLTDSAVLFAAWYQAIGRGDADDPLYGRYAGAGTRAKLREIIAMFRANGWTVTGSVLVNRRTAKIIGETAKVAWCADVREAFPMETSSGHVLHSPTGDQSFLLYRATMHRNDAGIWAASSLTSQRAAATCLPS
jgi:hypothetical protein